MNKVMSFKTKFWNSCLHSFIFLGLSELLSSCLKMNPDERPQAKNLIKTRW